MFLRPRPTIYKGTLMRSRLEATHAASLDARVAEHGGSWQYEPRCFADETGQYLPDFLYTGWSARGGDFREYQEVKPFIEDVEELQRRMEIIWRSDPGGRWRIPGETVVLLTIHDYSTGDVWEAQRLTEINRLGRSRRVLDQPMAAWICLLPDGTWRDKLVISHVVA